MIIITEEKILLEEIMKQYIIDQQKINEILSHRINTSDERAKRNAILEKVLKSDVIVIPFDKTFHYSYKHHKNIILHYASKNFLHKLMTKSILKDNLPLLGFLVLNTISGSEIIPLAEISIETIYLPSELESYWNLILGNKKKEPNKSLYELYLVNCRPLIKNITLQKSFDTFFMQRKFDDNLILNDIIKHNDYKVNTNDSRLLWISCEILENISSSHLNINGTKVGIKDYLIEKKFGQHSIAYGLTIQEYLIFKKGLKDSEDYSIGEEALKKAFIYFDEIDKLKSINYLLRYKIFSENAWRDLLCTYQLNYTDNMKSIFNVLFHIIWEIKNNTKYVLIDYDKEIKCTNVDDNTKQYYLDSFIHLYDTIRCKTVKLYIEFKNFDKTINENNKDYYHQPQSIIQNKFVSDRYVHHINDEWFYIAVSKNSPYKVKRNSVKLSGLKETNYINLKWEELFEVLEKYVFEKAYNSIDKSLLNFIKFLERI